MKADYFRLLPWSWESDCPSRCRCDLSALSQALFGQYFRWNCLWDIFSPWCRKKHILSTSWTLLLWFSTKFQLKHLFFLLIYNPPLHLSSPEQFCIHSLWGLFRIGKRCSCRDKYGMIGQTWTSRQGWWRKYCWVDRPRKGILLHFPLSRTEGKVSKIFRY